MVSRRKRSNSSVGNKLNTLTDKVTGQEKLQQVVGTQTNAVTNDSIALGAVNTESVADRSITSSKIGRGEVTSENLGVINEIIASGGLDIETGVDGHLSLSGGKYEAPYDGIEDADGYKILAFDPTNNTVKVIDNTPVINLDDIDDVTITSASEGQTLLYTSGGYWANANTPSQNYLINSGFDIWQRGTSGFTVSNEYGADRWINNRSAGTHTVSRSTDTPTGAGFQYSLSFASTSGTNPQIVQRIESVHSLQFAGQLVTLSVWAKSTVGTGGLGWAVGYPGGVDDWGVAATQHASGTFTATMTLGTWTRYSATFTANSLATRGYYIVVYRTVTTTSTTTLYAGVQLELGSVATAFRRNSSNIQAELAACQRYYQRIVAKQAFSLFGTGVYNTTTEFYIPIHLPVDLRAIPAFSYGGAVRILSAAGETISSLTIYTYSTTNPVSLEGVSSAGTDDGYAAVLTANNDVAAYLEFDSEL